MGKIRVAVPAAAIIFAELTWPETWESDGVDRSPIIPAHELAGPVDEVSSGVDDLGVGDPVFGLVPFDRDGAATEFVVLPASTVVRKAPSVDEIDAAASVLPVLTAWEALRDHGGSGSGSAAPGAGRSRRGRRLPHSVRAEGRRQGHRDGVLGVRRSLRQRLGADQVIVARDLGPGGQLVGFDAATDAVGDELPE